MHQPLTIDVEDAWFTDPDRGPADNLGPFLIVLDDFYPDPEAIRRFALSQQFVSYSPPERDRLSPRMARRLGKRPGHWRSSAFVTYLGETIARPFHGARHNPEALRERLSQVVGEEIDQHTWATGGDYWNGAFHLIDANWRSEDGLIHHHYKPGDVETRGWSGVVYLSLDAPAAAGTSIWRHRGTGLCVAGYGARFSADPSLFELVRVVENRFNRLVLFRENVLHRVEYGFGEDLEARLTQTFFFSIGGKQAGAMTAAPEASRHQDPQRQLLAHQRSPT